MLKQCVNKTDTPILNSFCEIQVTQTYTYIDTAIILRNIKKSYYSIDKNRLHKCNNILSGGSHVTSYKTFILFWFRV